MNYEYKAFAFERYDPTDESIAWLRTQGVEVEEGYALWEMPFRRYSDEEVIERAKDCDALMGASGTRISESLMDKLPRLKVISKYGIGVDSIDVGAATERGILVTNTPSDHQIFTVSEFAVAMMLSLAKQFDTWTRDFMRAGGWRGLTHSVTLRGATIGIVGLGRIGKGVADRLAGWGAKIVAYDPFMKDGTDGIELMELPELLRLSDFVTLHAPPRADGKPIIDRAAFGAMKKGAFLVNTGRGSLVDYGALRAALEEGRLQGAALDVYDREPPDPDDVLFRMPNVLCTPHVAAWTSVGTREIGWHAARNMVAALKGEGHADIVNPEALRSR